MSTPPPKIRPKYVPRGYLSYRPYWTGYSLPPPYFELPAPQQQFLFSLKSYWEQPAISLPLNPSPHLQINDANPNLPTLPYLGVSQYFNCSGIQTLHLVGRHTEPMHELEDYFDQIPSLFPGLLSFLLEDSYCDHVPRFLANTPHLISLRLILSKLTSIPTSLLVGLPKLRVLSLHSDQLESLPDIFDTFTDFRALHLYHLPSLKRLPDSLYRCPTLEMIYFSPHPFFEITLSQLRDLIARRITVSYCGLPLFPDWLDEWFQMLHPLYGDDYAMSMGELARRNHLRVNFTVLEAFHQAKMDPFNPFPVEEEILYPGWKEDTRAGENRRRRLHAQKMGDPHFFSRKENAELAKRKIYSLEELRNRTEPRF